MNAEEFVRAWQAATSVRELCDEYGLVASRVYKRAVDLRKRGVPLKRFPKKAFLPVKLDIPALAALCAPPSSGEPDGG